MADDNFSWGAALALLTGTALITYTTWKIRKRREELREGIELLTDAHQGFVDDLDAMVSRGELTPITDAPIPR
jgi:hypothetical protein